MAIVSLVFVSIFTVSLVLCLAMPTALNHGFGYITLFSGFVGISVFFVIKLSEKGEKKPPEITADDTDEDTTENKEPIKEEQASTEEEKTMAAEEESAIAEDEAAEEEKTDD